MPSNNVQITFRGLPASPSVINLVHRKIDKLQLRYRNIVRSRVVIELPHQHHHKGQKFQVTVDLAIPHDEIVVTKSQSDKDHENVYVTVRDAFTAVQKQLQRRCTRPRTRHRFTPEPVVAA